MLRTHFSKFVEIKVLHFKITMKFQKGEIPMKRKTTKEYIQKTLAIELIRLGHDLNHTMRNRKDERFQIYVLSKLLN